MFPHLNMLFTSSKLKYIKERYEAQIWTVELSLVWRNPLKLLPFNPILLFLFGFRHLSVWVQTSSEEMITFSSS